MSSKISLYQALKQTGKFLSKAEITKVISSGKVTVDDVPTTALKFQFSPKKRIVCVEGKQISFVAKKYIVMNKPAGYSCQKNDNFAYVMNLLDLDAQTKNSLFPIGRLDIPTIGLIIITNDGTLSALLSEPKRNVTKTYRALLKQKITQEQINSLNSGVSIEVDSKFYKTLPAVVTKLDENNIEISITEGKYR